jgi:hypothetical protein
MYEMVTCFDKLNLVDKPNHINMFLKKERKLGTKHCS